MAYSLHFVPSRHTREVLLSLFPSGSLGQPITQRTWANLASLRRDLAALLGPREAEKVGESISAGRDYLLAEISLSESQLDQLGL